MFLCPTKVLLENAADDQLAQSLLVLRAHRSGQNAIMKELLLLQRVCQEFNDARTQRGGINNKEGCYIGEIMLRLTTPAIKCFQAENFEVT